MDTPYIIKIGNVESVEDENGGNRIKVRLDQDKNRPVKDLPYAFPLLPKTIQVIPKKNEGVLVITSQINNIESNRYYIGPIISQPQEMSFANYGSNGYGEGISLLTEFAKKHATLENYKEYSDGAFPEKEDVALIGRESEDIILKDSEIDIRCGIRGDGLISDDNLSGKVIFNNSDPAYIQLKYAKSQQVRSVINIVGDRINLASTSAAKDITNSFHTKEDGNINEKEMHQVPYGDILVQILDMLQNAIVNHKHVKRKEPPYTASDDGAVVNDLKTKYNVLISNLLSNTVYTS